MYGSMNEFNCIFLIGAVFLFSMISCSDETTAPENPVLSDIILESNHHFADSLTVSVAASDPQGLDDVDSVWGRFSYLGEASNEETIYFLDNGLEGDSVAGDGRYSARFIPLAGQFELGYYTLFIKSADASGNLSAEVTGLFWSIDGDGPVLCNPLAPDSLQRGSEGTSQVTVIAYDPDGLADIDSVYFISTRPDGSSNGAHLYMFDDGSTYDDAVAGDGQYTITIQHPDSSSQLGDYVFTFYALDIQENQSNNPEHILTVY